MDYAFANRIRVLTPTQGTGTLTLGAALIDMQAFSGNVADGSAVTYTIEDGPLAWECGSGTYHAGVSGAADTLTRDTVEASSAGGALIVLSGNANVYITPTASWLNNLQERAGTVLVSDTAPVGASVNTLWWDSAGTGLYVNYNDGNSTQWVVAENQVSSVNAIIADTAPTAQASNGTLWWDSTGTGLYIRYNDGTSTQWVAAQNPYTLTDAPIDTNTYGRSGGAWVNLTSGSNAFLPLAGNATVTGPTTFSAAGTGLNVTNNIIANGTIQGVGGITVGNSGASNTILSLNGAVATQRRLEFNTANSLRWRFGASFGAESGSNAGSDLFINAYSDTGSLIGSPLTLVRATQQLQLNKLRIGGAATLTFQGVAWAYDQGAFAINYNYTGSTDHSGWAYLNYLGFASDVVDVGASNQAIGLGAIHYFGGTGITGGRTGFRYVLSQTGACPARANYQGGFISVDASYSSGGTDLWANNGGTLFGQGIGASINSGATNYGGVVGLEIGYAIASGASARGVNGLQVFRGNNHAYQPAIWELDTGIIIGNSLPQAGAKFGFQLSGSYWGLDPTNGRVMGAQFSTNWWTTYPLQAAHGIDFYNINLTGTAFRARGFSVLGSGASLPAGSVQAGNAYLSSSGATVSLDTPGSTCTAATIATGGANLIVGTALIHDATGTLAVVTAVSSGVATAITLTANTGFAITPPSNPVTFRVSAEPTNLPGAPTSPTLNLTWTTSNGLSLNPTGQHIGFNGTTPIAKPAVSGACAGNTAIKALLTALAAYGLVTDSTTA